MPKKTNIEWIQEWYLSCCNEDWEHVFGIRIVTLDNPGWMVTIDLRETPLEQCSIPTLAIERSEEYWIHCRVDELKFEGFGGACNLDGILGVFRKWAQEAIGEDPLQN